MKETVGGVLSTARVMVARQEREKGGSPGPHHTPKCIQPETSNSAIQPLLAYDSEDWLT